MKREVKSAGILIKSGDRFLLCHATGMKADKGWGLPKGRVDAGESLKHTAVRETQEECGLEIDPNKIKELTSTQYRSNDNGEAIIKKLYVFLFETDEELQKQPLACTTFFTPRWADNENVKIPEVDKFKWVTLDEAKHLAMQSIKGVFDLF